MIRKFCQQFNIKVVYYRKLKTGHVPMRRECKLRGDINRFLLFASQEGLMLENYPRDTKQADKELAAGVLSFDEWYKKYKSA